MSGLPPPPPGLDIHATKQPELYAAQLTTYVLAVIAVGLRFWARKLLKAGYWLDDWIAVAALVVATGLFASSLVWISQGYGKHLWVLGPTFVTEFFKNLFIGEILYTLIIVLVKYSILAFYWRLFTQSIHLPVYILGGITTAWGIAVILVTIFQCKPVSNFFESDFTKRNCIVNDYAFFVGIAVPNILTDAALMSLPVPYIWKLHRSRSQKIALAVIFMLGSFVTIISIVRLATLVSVNMTSPDLDWNFTYVGVWTITESNMAIVSGCLPSLRPILSLAITGSPNPSAYATGNRYASGKSLKRSQNISTGSRTQPDQISESDSQHQFVPLDDETDEYSRFKNLHSTVVAGDRQVPASDIEMQGLPNAPRGINVRSDVAVKWTGGGR